MEGSSLTVVKSNKLIEASYRLSLDEQRLLLSCISKLDSRSDLSKIDRLKLTSKEFSLFSGINSKNAYKQLEEAARNLFERRMSFYDPDTDDLLVTRWVSSIKYNQRNGNVELCFAQDVLPLISQIKSHFTKYKIENIANLTSVHAIRIYELCLQYLSIGSREIDLTEFKYYLGIEIESYPEFKVFNRDVLKKSIDQINKHTDIKVAAELIRENRKVIGLRFEIESKTSRSHKVSKQKTEKELKDLAKNLTITDYLESKNLENTKTKQPKFILN